MSENQIILQLTRIEKMLSQQSLLYKEVLTTKEAANYLGLSRDYVNTLARRNLFPTSRPHNGKRFYKRRDLDNWMLSSDKLISFPLLEAEKMSILNPERS